MFRYSQMAELICNVCCFNGWLVDIGEKELTWETERLSYFWKAKRSIGIRFKSFEEITTQTIYQKLKEASIWGCLNQNST